MDREKVFNDLVFSTVMARESNTPFVALTHQAAEDLIKLLKEQETANFYKCQNCGTWVSAENVVRCKDCKHYEYGCKLWHTIDYQNDDWFCADGTK